jgi:predicted amidohydrolase
MKIQRKTLARRNAAADRSVLRVAAVQFRSGGNLTDNLNRMFGVLAMCAKRGVQVVAFPECSLTSYVPSTILRTAPDAIAAAEAKLAESCGELKISALVGTVQTIGRQRRNAALIIDPSGRIRGRYAKQYLVGVDRSWHCLAGEQLPPVFSIETAKASVIICHDNRYPELCRLPVLSGAQVIFYLSHECNLTKRSKLGPCRAQVQARAVENNVFIVHANAPSDGGDRGSHGESRIVAPDGNILLEACQRHEEILISDLDLRLATRTFALNSLSGPHRTWWREGIQKVPIIR